ncbi:MAG TPA: aminotransferase [Candidatus Nanopelagicales bacterium]|nr:aminotransferase [Candidatus Nanopelagicales bacterium]
MTAHDPAAASAAAHLDVAPRPGVDVGRAAELASTLFGAEGEVRELGSHQDRNFRVDTAAGRRVLKVANRGWGRAALEAQNAALLHIAEQAPGFAAPVPVPALDGSMLVEVADGDASIPVRLLTYVEGTPLTGRQHLSPQVVSDLGRLSAQASAALAGFEHPGLDRVVQWDLRQAGPVLASLLGSIADPDRRALVADCAAGAAERLELVADRLRVQAIHGDVTDDNVVGHRDEAGRLRPDGIIDFGDLTRSWLVSDIAVTVSSILRHEPDEPFVALEAVRAFHDVVPLDDADVAALWPLVVLRGATLVASGEHQATLDPDNELVIEPLEGEWRIFHTARTVDLDLAEAAIRAALGMGQAPRHADALAAVTGSGPLFPSVSDWSVVDLSATSPSLHSGRFLDPGAERAVLAEAGAPSATRWAEARLTRTVLDSPVAPATYALGVDLLLPAGTDAASPWDGVVAEVDGSTVRVDGAGGRLTVTGLRPAVATGDVVVRGGTLGTVGGGDVHVGLCVDPGLATPSFATPHTAGGWLALCPDPSPLLGVDVAAAHDDVDGLLARRVDALATVQEHYYAAPMRIERGWKQYLVDTTGRTYLDMVNNVAAIGHGHPRLADAVEQQLRTFNSNSRFHYAAITEFSERLADLAPEGLDTVFLVNSGSEAVDLALRIAQVVTHRMDVMAVREAYHGWTLLSDAVTTSLYDNPTALESRPEWAHFSSAPNTFRGRFRGAGSGDDYAAEVRELVTQLASEGRPPAAFICEPVSGNAGGVMLPEGYLAQVYDAVREVGGLCIADEVQVGYGRLGHHWWAFDMHGVTPDVITVAKAMGNGHPLGAVITTREIADAFAHQGSFFSSAGGSPVSCITGITVLDVIRDEGLQENAAVVGDRLIAKAEELQERYPIIGAIHGMGLYLGIELVQDRETLEPATAECYAICDRLRDLGVIVQPTGERANVLKMKPPMCLTVASADFYIEMLETVLREGW